MPPQTTSEPAFVDSAGNGLELWETWEFTTAADTEAPRAGVVTPFSGAVVPFQSLTSFRVDFTEEVCTRIIRCLSMFVCRLPGRSRSGPLLVFFFEKIESKG